MLLEKIILETRSLQRTKLFYHKTLELGLLEETEEQICFRAGRTELCFRQAESGKPFYHFAFNITNNRFSDAFEWISSKLDILPVEPGVFIAGYPNWNAQSFYFTDNNGSILEFITRFDLPYFSQQPFSSSCLEEISEIGLVTEDPEELAKTLIQTNGIPYFSKGPRLPDFIPLGDDEGLLLVCRTQKPWVPTHRKAIRYPVIIQVAGRTIYHK